jgi:hypothetical protein
MKKTKTALSKDDEERRLQLLQEQRDRYLE